MPRKKPQKKKPLCVKARQRRALANTQRPVRSAQHPVSVLFACEVGGRSSRAAARVEEFVDKIGWSRFFKITVSPMIEVSRSAAEHYDMVLVPNSIITQGKLNGEVARNRDKVIGYHYGGSLGETGSALFDRIHKRASDRFILDFRQSK